jgi:hypothetical protein
VNFASVVRGSCLVYRFRDSSAGPMHQADTNVERHPMCPKVNRITVFGYCTLVEPCIDAFAGLP